jgi:hypothetical protein
MVHYSEFNFLPAIISKMNEFSGVIYKVIVYSKRELFHSNLIDSTPYKKLNNYLINIF